MEATEEQNVGSVAKRIISDIQEILGEDCFESLAFSDIHRRLNLGFISRETLRNIVFKGYSPKTSTTGKIISHLEKLKGHKGSLLVEANDLAHDMLDLFRNDSSVIKLDEISPFEIVITYVGNLKLCVAAFNALEGTTKDDFFKKALDYSLRIKSQEFDKAMIIYNSDSDNTFSSEVPGVELSRFSELLRTIISFDHINQFIEDRLRQKNIYLAYKEFPLLDKILCEKIDSPISEVTDRFLKNRGAINIVSLVGSFGSGKTSLALKIAESILDSSESSDYRSTLIPVWLNARDLDVADTKDAILSAVNGMCPNNRLSRNSLENLIYKKRIVIFLDGVDESRNTTRYDSIISLMSRFLDIGVHDLFITVRKEVFSCNEHLMNALYHFPEKAGTSPNGVMPYIYETMPMDIEDVFSVIRERYDSKRSYEIIKNIESNKPIQDIVTRPIFMHIVSETRCCEFDNNNNIYYIFDKYISQWVSIENKKVAKKSTVLSEKERTLSAEIIAFHISCKPGSNQSLSMDELTDVCKSIKDKISVSALVHDVKLSMFLINDENSDEWAVKFSHDSIREYLLSRFLINSIRSGSYREIGCLPIYPDSNVLVRFICEGLSINTHNPTETIANAIMYHPTSNSDGTSIDVGNHSFFCANMFVLSVELSRIKGLKKVRLKNLYLPREQCRVIMDYLSDVTDISVQAYGNFEGIEELDISLKSHSITSTTKQISERVSNNISEFKGLNFDYVLIGGSGRAILTSKDAPKMVDIPSFFIKRHPVTNFEFHSFIQENPEWGPEPVREEYGISYYLQGWPVNEDILSYDESWLLRPVVQVSWHAAAAYCSWVGGRLPTEVEWEVAARYAHNNPTSNWPWGDDSEREMGYFLNSSIKDTPLFPTNQVDDYPESARDFYNGNDIPIHMAGLISEWVFDAWDDIYPMDSGIYSVPMNIPCNESFKWDREKNKWCFLHYFQNKRVVRGGSFQRLKEESVIQKRSPLPSQNVNPDLGFRVVKLIK